MALPDEALFPREKGLEGVHLPRAYRFLCQPVGLVVSGIVAMPWHPVEANWGGNNPRLFSATACPHYKRFVTRPTSPANESSEPYLKDQANGVEDCHEFACGP
jgi:hypothetical protein